MARMIEVEKLKLEEITTLEITNQKVREYEEATKKREEEADKEHVENERKIK